MEIVELINHPERMDRDTLYELLSTLALYPYFQTARLLMLQNLYLLHDTSFDEELRRAAVYITDRKVIFDMIEAAHYQLRKNNKTEDGNADKAAGNGSRTISLIDTFLDSIPPEDEEVAPKRKRRKPTPADATVDYVAYLLENESIKSTTSKKETPQLKGQNLIDSFLANEHGRLTLSELPTPTFDAEIAPSDDEDDEPEEEFFTETLARIYIKQGRYQKALEIIERLSSNFPNKNVYFADQIRFLEKLIINNNKQKQ